MLDSFDVLGGKAYHLHMFTLLNLFFDICLFRRGPQDVPDAPALMVLTVLAYIGTGLAMVLRDSSVILSFAQVGIDFFTMAGLLYVLLHLKNLLGHYAASLTAMAGTGALLNILALPLVSWAISTGEAAQASAISTPGLLVLLLVMWSFAVMGHIFRHALRVSFPVGLLAGTAYLILSVLLTRPFVPEVPV